MHEGNGVFRMDIAELDLLVRAVLKYRLERALEKADDVLASAEAATQFATGAVPRVYRIGLSYADKPGLIARRDIKAGTEVMNDQALFARPPSMAFIDDNDNIIPRQWDTFINTLRDLSPSDMRKLFALQASNDYDYYAFTSLTELNVALSGDVSPSSMVGLQLMTTLRQQAVSF